MDNDLNNNIQNITLQNNWKLWYHAPDNKNWNIDSYKNLYTITTINDFWYIYNRLNNNHLQYGMFFLMKNDILPMWEDINNVNGGCWALKVMKKDTFNVWLELSIALIGQHITCLSENSYYINGITISPKKNFSIIKIWCSDKNINNIKFLNDTIPNVSFSDAIYKSHLE